MVFGCAQLQTICIVSFPDPMCTSLIDTRCWICRKLASRFHHTNNTRIVLIYRTCKQQNIELTVDYHLRRSVRYSNVIRKVHHNELISVSFLFLLFNVQKCQHTFKQKNNVKLHYKIRLLVGVEIAPYTKSSNQNRK